MHLVRRMKSSRSEPKSVPSRTSHVDHALELNLGWPKLDMSTLIDSNVDLFMYLIEWIRLGTFEYMKSSTFELGLSYVSFTVICLCFLVAARRYIFNWTHRIVGISAFILAGELHTN